MSFENISPAMQPVVEAGTVQDALVLLAPSKEKGVLLVGDGIHIAAQAAAADGQALVYDSSKATGLSAASIPVYVPMVPVDSVQDGGGIWDTTMTPGQPRILVDANCQRVFLPEGSLVTSDLEIKIPAGGQASVAFSTTADGNVIDGVGAQPYLASHGQSVKFTFVAATNTFYVI